MLGQILILLFCLLIIATLTMSKVIWGLVVLVTLIVAGIGIAALARIR